MPRTRALAVVVCLSLLAFVPFAQGTSALSVMNAAEAPSFPDQLLPAIDVVSLVWNTTVDCFSIGLVSGSSFAAPDVLTNFDDASWTQNTGLSGYADASGNPAMVSFDLNFVAPLAVGTQILVAGYVGGSVFVNVEGEYFGNEEWLFQNTPEPNWDPKGSVPEPTTLFLLGTGIAALATRRARRRR